MEIKIPRLMIAGVCSGGGKTTVTCGLLSTLVARGLKTASFKCGPDYIDPMFHSEVIGAKSRNLDLFMADENTARYLLCKNAAGYDISVLEGVMGYYDGLAGKSLDASSWALARATQTPTILVVDCKGMSVSAAAIAKGYLEFRESGIAGLLLNRVPKRLYAELKDLMETELGVPVLGYLPAMSGSVLQSRHLGLVTAAEVTDLKEKLGQIAAQMEETVDIKKLLAIAKSAPVLSCDAPDIPCIKKDVTIAVARDNAFCFYYQDNIDLLVQMGAKIIEFSPMQDKEIPKDADGLLLGGGYPELYAKELSTNQSMLSSVRQRIAEGLPTIAECGGFMYLHLTMEDSQGEKHTMAGTVPGECFRTNRLNRFGYLALTAKENTMLLRAGEFIRGHEFHYWDSTAQGEAFTASQPLREGSWQCGFGTDALYAGFPHLYFYGNSKAAFSFMQVCAAYAAKKGRMV
jgi:cobyrinic acid a,c-diamide synthase